MVGARGRQDGIHFADAQMEAHSGFMHCPRTLRFFSLCFSLPHLHQILDTLSYFPASDRTHYFIISHPNSKTNISSSLSYSRSESPWWFLLGQSWETTLTCSLNSLRLSPFTSHKLWLHLGRESEVCGLRLFLFVLFVFL